MEDDVRVREKKIIRLVDGNGMAGRECHGMGLAEPARGKLCDVKDGELIGMLRGEGIHHGAGCVGGAIVNRDDAEIEVVLIQKRLERSSDVGGFVARGDDDDEGGIAGWNVVPLLVKKVRDAWEAAGCTDKLPEPRESDEPREHGNAEL